MTEKIMIKSKIIKFNRNKSLSNSKACESLIIKSNKIQNVKFRKNIPKKSKFIFKNINSIFINILFIKFILISFLEKTLSYPNSNNYILLKVNNTGDQQIFSDYYNISKFYPDRIYVGNRIQILRDKNVLINTKNDIIRIEWFNTYPNMSYMFANLESITSVTINNMLNNSLNNLSYMFYNCHNLQSFSFIGSKTNYEIGDLSKMFYNCYSLTSVSFLNSYQASDINLSYIFYNCHELNYIYFSSTMKVNNLHKMCYNCYSLESLDLNKINSEKEINMAYLCYNCSNLIFFSNTGSNILTNDMSFMFYNCYNLTFINLNNFIISSSTNISYLFYNCQNLSNFEWNSGLSDSNNPSDMRNMFYNCFSLNSIYLPFIKTNNNTNMARMFFNCYNLININLASNSLYYPNDIHAMFYNCSSLQNLNIANKIITNYVSDMSYLFYNCSSLTSLNIKFSNELTINMKSVFENCISLISLDLSNFYTPNAEIMWNMFKGCNKLETLNLIKFDTSKVTDMESMFEGCYNLISLSLEHFKTDKVQYMNKMFKDCVSLTSLNFKNIDNKLVGTMYQMFYNCQNLEYLNLYGITEIGQSIEDMFTNTSNNFTFCIKENENIPKIFDILLDMDETIRDCSDNCYEQERVNISSKKLCCPFVRYKDNCYRKCPAKTQIKDKINICEDFNCPNSNEYYDYEQNNCIKDIKGYYINDTIHKTIDKCHEDCEDCDERWNNISTKCTKCKEIKPYIYLGNCYENCEPGFDENNKCKCFNTKCKSCSEKSLEYNLCITCNKDYYPIIDDRNNYNNWIDCYKDPYYYFLDNDIYKACYSSCEYCSQKGNYEKQYCLSCNMNNTYSILMDESIDNIYNCYPNCTYYYYFDENKKYQCTKDNKCPKEYSKLIYNDRRCVKSCSETKYNKYEFREICYEECPPDKSFISNETNDYFCKITCPFEEPFEMVKKQICVSNCTIMERKDKLCITNYIGNRSNDEVQNKVMANLQDDIIDTFDFHYLNENTSIILEEIDNTYEILTTNKKEDSSQTKTSYIYLGQCETTLKNYYTIDINEPLYILKLDAYREGLQNPKVVYLVYYPLNGYKLEQLDLTLCEGDGVSLLFSANITGDEDLYNKNSGYYNDVCYTYTSDDGTDISLIDRQQEFADNNQSLCEEGCEFVKYHYDKDKAECSCNVKTEAPLVSEIKIDKDALYKFIDIKKIANFDVMRCYNLLLDKKGIVKNIGIYIFLPTFIMYFICIIIFFRKEYLIIKNDINEIVEAKINLKYIMECEKKYGDNDNKLIYLNMLKSKGMLSKRLRNRTIKNKLDKIQLQNNNELKEENDNKKKIYRNMLIGNNIYNEIESNEIGKTITIKKKLKLKMTKRINLPKNNAPPIKFQKVIKTKGILGEKGIDEIIEQKNSNKDSTTLRKQLIETSGIPKETEGNKDLNMIEKYKGRVNQEEKEKIKDVLKYNDNELNAMNYQEALKNDHRTFFVFYFALLKSKHVILAIFEKKDYNSRIIKIFLCFFNFASCYAINGLFFDDDTMHKIYEDKGKYNLLAQLPQIIYSSIIGYFLDNLLNFLALSEDDIIGIKQEKEIDTLGKKKEKTSKTLHAKFIIFFILSFLLLILFWYYTSCFCAVYKNTQFHLLKDTLISFATSMGTPFGIYLIPAIFRIPALKKKSKSNHVMYVLSKIVQFF